MAHAAPASRGTTGTAGTTGTTGASGQRGRGPAALPDVFGPGVHRAVKYGLPVVIGLVYGFWAAANRRHGGPITGGNLLFGFMTALGYIVLNIAVGVVAERSMREVHAVLWAAFAGTAVGFLYAQSGVAVFTCVVVSLAVAAGVFAVLFYRYYTHEDATGRRID